MATRSTYVYGSAARDLSAPPAPERFRSTPRPERTHSRPAAPRQQVRVVRGSGTVSAPRTAPAFSVGRAVAFAVAALVVVAVAACIRLALSSAAIATSLDSQQISNSIQDVRTASTSLEIEQSTLANPARISAEAKRLGMAAPSSVGVIELAPDVVVLDGDGALSLSQSVDSLIAIEG